MTKERKIKQLSRVAKMLMLIGISSGIAACSSDEAATSPVTTDTGSQDAVLFDAQMGTAQSAGNNSTSRRTPAHAIESNATLNTEGGFGVFACYTGLYKYADSNVHPDYMYNQPVTSSDGGTTWTYSPVKYWPNGEGQTNNTIVTGENPHYVSFMAYAPYSNTNDNNPAGYCIPTFSAQGAIGNPWLTYRLHTNVANQVDLLYAQPQLDQKKPSLGEKVSFTFNHALACVGDKVTIQCSDGLKNQLVSRVENTSATDAKVVVKSLSITYTLTEKARMILWNGGTAPNWQTILSEEPVCTRTVNLIAADQAVYQKTNASLESIIINDKGVFYIPVELTSHPQTALVSITYCIGSTSSADDTGWNYDASTTASTTLTMKEFEEAYKPGRHLYINIILNQSDIALTAAIAPWTEADPVEVEGEEQ